MDHFRHTCALAFTKAASQPMSRVVLYRITERMSSMNAVTTLAAAVSLTLLTVAGAARAADECGPAGPGVTIRCTASGYDAAADGKFFFQPGLAGGDFSLRLEPGLSVAYDRRTSDDALRDVTVSVTGEDAHSVGVAHSGAGDIDVALRDLAVNAKGDTARGVWLQHKGTGAIDLTVEGGRIDAAGADAIGILASYGDNADDRDFCAFPGPVPGQRVPPHTDSDRSR